MTRKVRSIGHEPRCDERAKKARDTSDREWQMILARAYRMLAEVEIETAARPQSAAA